MEFQKERVFTALNADELKVGSKVILADTLNELKKRVERDYTSYILARVCGESHENRFELASWSHFALAYLVSEPEEKKLKWTDLKVGDVITNGDESAMVIHIRKNDKNNHHICAGDGWWFSDLELEKWEKMEEK